MIYIYVWSIYIISDNLLLYIPAYTLSILTERFHRISNETETLFVHSNELSSYLSNTILSAPKSTIEKTATIPENNIINSCAERIEGQACTRFASIIRATREGVRIKIAHTRLVNDSCN